MSKTEFILVNPRTSEIVDINKAEKMGLHNYIIEDEEGDLTSMDGKKKWESCMKIRKTPFKDVNGFEIWEDDIIRINGRKASLSYKGGKFYYSYLFDENGNETEPFKDLIRLHSHDMKKAEYLNSLYRKTGYEKEGSDYSNHNYYEDVIVTIKTIKKDHEEMWQDWLKKNPNTDKELFDNEVEKNLKRLKKIKESFEKNPVKS